MKHGGKVAGKGIRRGASVPACLLPQRDRMSDDDMSRWAQRERMQVEGASCLPAGSSPEKAGSYMSTVPASTVMNFRTFLRGIRGSF